MARRVFFSFHFDGDIWRANQVRNSNVVVGTNVAGFFDHSEYQDAQMRGDSGIRRMILNHLSNTTVTIVLVGSMTAYRPWVQQEIADSIERKNGLLGIHIHHLKDQYGNTSFRGVLPAVPYGVEFPAYDWDGDVGNLARQIEAAGRRAEAWRARA
jgi:MTH538 TIR-like domain (DUF1863)